MEENNKLLHTELCGFKDIVDERLKSVSEVLHRIEIQTIATNGRVRKLEAWRSFITGGLAILSLLVIPMIIMVFSSFIG